MKLLSTIIFLCFGIYAKTITFSPLPMDKAQKLFIHYNKMLKYLQKETGYRFKFIYSASYKELIQNFKDGKVDIIELGALPYIKLQQQVNNAEPFITFKSKNGKPYYTCDLVTTEADINSFDDIKQDDMIILTRPLSTCGYLMSEYMMRKHKQTLKNFDYKYVGTHSSVLLNLLLKSNTIGTAKSTVVDKYRQFNFKILEKSPHIPGFTFVANKNKISQNEIKKIQTALLKLDPLNNKQDAKIVEKWSLNIKYGAIKTNKHIYDVIAAATKEIPIPKEKKHDK